MATELRDLIKQYGNQIPIEELWAANTRTREEVMAAQESERMQRERDAGMTVESAVDREHRLVEIRCRKAGIPERFLGTARDARWNGQLKGGRGVYVFGPNGVGKTTMACGIAKGWLSEVGPGATFTGAESMCTDVTSAVSDGRDLDSVVGRYSSCPLLVIDDAGKESVTPFWAAKLFGIVDARYAAGLPTVWTSNLSVPELCDRISRRGDESTAQAIATRINNTCQIVSLGKRS